MIQYTNVYVYLDTANPGKYTYKNITFDYKPFYVGIGRIKRSLFHIKEATSKSKNIVNPYKTRIIKNLIKRGLFPNILFIYENIGREEANSIERDFIKTFGRIIDESGILTNITEGGDGGDTISNNINRKEILKKFRIRSGGENNPMYGKLGECNPNSYKYVIYKNSTLECVIYGGKEVIKWISDNKMSQTTFRKLASKKKLCHNKIEIYKLNKTDDIDIVPMSMKQIEEYENKIYKEMISKTKNNTKLVGIRKYKVVNPNGEVFIVDNFSKFCRENNLHRATFRLVAYGKKQDYYGWKCEIIN